MAFKQRQCVEGMRVMLPRYGPRWVLYSAGYWLMRKVWKWYKCIWGPQIYTPLDTTRLELSVKLRID
jgi:hypothetical protein